MGSFTSALIRPAPAASLLSETHSSSFLLTMASPLVAFCRMEQRTVFWLPFIDLEKSIFHQVWILLVHRFDNRSAPPVLCPVAQLHVLQPLHDLLVVVRLQVLGQLPAVLGRHVDRGRAISLRRREARGRFGRPRIGHRIVWNKISHR